MNENRKRHEQHDHAQHDAGHESTEVAHAAHGNAGHGQHDHAQHGAGQNGTEVAHAAHGNAGHGQHGAQFRDRFWVSLVLTVPVIVFSEMLGHLLGYEPPSFPGSAAISPVVGTVVLLYGGWPFLTGAVTEARARRPGMMMLVSLAITVAFVSSWSTTLGIGGMDLDFWWELALLIVIMLLGHWLEMRALGAASGALDALAALLPDRAERVDGDTVTEVPLGDLRTGDVVLVRPQGGSNALTLVRIRRLRDGNGDVDRLVADPDRRRRPGRAAAPRVVGHHGPARLTGRGAPGRALAR